MKIQKKNWGGGDGLGGSGRGVPRGGGQGGCKRRIEVFVKIQIKNGGGGRVGEGGFGLGGGVSLNANKELKYLCKFKKKMGGWKFKKNGGGGRGGGVGLGGQGGCERKIEVFVKIKKKKGERVGEGVVG